jgi:hypothetical protein
MLNAVLYIKYSKFANIFQVSDFARYFRKEQKTKESERATQFLRAFQVSLHVTKGTT